MLCMLYRLINTFSLTCCLLNVCKSNKGKVFLYLSYDGAETEDHVKTELQYLYCNVHGQSIDGQRLSKHARNNRSTSVYCLSLGNKQRKNEFTAVSAATVAMQ
jgi:hypothetical protein